MPYAYDYAVYIGRFQPFHRGHYHVASEALKLAKNLIFIIGSHGASPSIRNPFSSEARKAIISACFTEDELSRIHFGVQHDHTYNDDRWVASLQDVVSSITMSKWRAGPTKIGLVGHDKDHSTFYLHKFPQWDYIPVSPVDDFNATKFREQWLTGELHMRDFISVPHMESFHKHADEVRDRIKEEYDMVAKYRQSWEAAPFPPTFNTVDSVVIQSGHVLLVERKHQPGKGLWAIPGGFLNVEETLLTAAIRELREETRLKVPVPVLNGSIVKQLTFDDPKRSTRGRTITQAFLFKLEDRAELPPVRGSDDASKAFWIPFAEARANRHMFYEDHFAILEVMIGI